MFWKFLWHTGWKSLDLINVLDLEYRRQFLRKMAVGVLSIIWIASEERKRQPPFVECLALPSIVECQALPADQQTSFFPPPYGYSYITIPSFPCSLVLPSDWIIAGRNRVEMMYTTSSSGLLQKKMSHNRILSLSPHLLVGSYGQCNVGAHMLKTENLHVLRPIVWHGINPPSHHQPENPDGDSTITLSRTSI